MLNVRISSRVFSKGFDISTPMGIFSAKRVALSPTGEILISNPSGNQIARLELESFLSSVYNIIITGGGFYQFNRENKSRRNWICKGEGRLLRVSELSKRRFSISDGDLQIADCSKARFTNNYTIRILDDTELKVVVSIFVALSVCEHEKTDSPA